MISPEATTANLDEQLAACLVSNRRLPFFARVAVEVSVATRSAYPRLAPKPARAVDGFICVNELVRLVGHQLAVELAAGTRKGADSTFMTSLSGQARAHNCEASLRSALGGALAALEPRPRSTATDPPPTGRARVTACLASDLRLAFFAELVYWLSLEARGLYPPPISGAYQEAAALICSNETVQKLAAQMRADLEGNGGGYPDRALVEVVLVGADVWGCADVVRSALTQALAAVTPS